MHSLDLVLAQADAYAAGTSLGLIVRTLILLTLGAALVRRVLRGEFGAGLRNSQAGTYVGLAAVTVLLVYSGSQIFDRGSAGFTDPAFAQGMIDLRAGCVDSGAPASYCECLTAELDARVPAAGRGEFSARMETSGNLSQVPELQASMDACKARAGGA